MKRVLLAVDNHEQRARQGAESILELPGGPADVTVVILNVFEKFSAADEGGQVHSEDLYDADQFPASVDAAREVLEAAGIDVETRREHGDPAAEILRIAEDVETDIIAVGGRKRSPTGKAIFGSVTQSVILDADYPVLVTTMD